jgi:NAD(P)-dependent dehydrogenase (short-subunit alcohol dehydrogenase family)
LRGTVNTLRHFLPAMIAAQRGVVVNFSASWGRTTAPKVAVYCASKWAIEGLTSALAKDLPKGLAAVALNPGIINTDMLQSIFAAAAAARYPKPADWAQAAAPFILALNAGDNGKSLDVPAV